MSTKAQKMYAIITDSEETARWAFAEIEKAYRIYWGRVTDRKNLKTKTSIVFDNGNEIVWLQAKRSFRGRFFQTVWADHKLDIDYVKKAIVPIVHSEKDIAWI